MSRKRMNKGQVLRLFRETHSEFLKKYKGDRIAKWEAWNIFTDGLCKDGEITVKQYESWDNPYGRQAR